MADNIPLYGFRPAGRDGSPFSPVAVEMTVATATSFDVSGGQANCALRKGDPVTLTSGGVVDLCDGFEASGTGVALWGIVAGISQYYDAVEGVLVKKDSLPSDVAWTLNQRASKVFVWPLHQYKYWEVDVDDNTTATTQEAYLALTGELCDHSLAGAASNLKINPRLDISTHGTSNGQWRFEGISPTLYNQDFSGSYVKVIVSPYELITTI
jgi:hypothetical protein